MTTKLKLLEHLIGALCPAALPAFVEAEAELLAVAEVLPAERFAALLRELGDVFAGFARTYAGGADGFEVLVSTVRATIAKAKGGA